MKINPLICLAAALSMAGCVRRTITNEPEIRTPLQQGKRYGANPKAEVVEKKLVWIWEDEFRNPK